MPTAYVTNMVAFRDYSQLRILFDSVAFLSSGASPDLDIERMSQQLIHATKEDSLVIDGAPLIASVALSIWLEHLGEANIIELKMDGALIPRRLSRTSLVRIIEQSFDQKELYRGTR